MASRSTDKVVNLGLLVLRAGIGGMFVWAHGGPKLMGGSEVWAKVGGAISTFGVTSDYATLFGLMAALAEGVGGALLVIGFLTRPAAFFMLCTMVVAAAMHLTQGDGLAIASHAIEAGVVFLSLLIAGAGRWSVDGWLKGRRKGNYDLPG